MWLEGEEGGEGEEEAGGGRRGEKGGVGDGGFVLNVASLKNLKCCCLC